MPLVYNTLDNIVFLYHMEKSFMAGHLFTRSYGSHSAGIRLHLQSVLLSMFLLGRRAKADGQNKQA